jgi:hypothetical protein
MLSCDVDAGGRQLQASLVYRAAIQGVQQVRQIASFEDSNVGAAM